jgi:hypothetical protein
MRRLFAYTREQFDRDPQRASIVAATIGVGLLVLIFAIVMLVSSGGGSNEGTGDAPAGSDAPSATQPVGAVAPGGTEAATASATAVATPEPLTGAPYGEAEVTSALQTRGLNAAFVDQPFTCQNANTTPRTYRVNGVGGTQEVVLLVYSDSAAMNTDWVIGGGRPQYRNGSCADDAAVIYFNANLLLVFPQTTSAALQSQIVDAFLTLP